MAARKRKKSNFSTRFSEPSAKFMLVVLTILELIYSGNSQLVVNVKNAGGDLIQENIQAYPSQDLIELDFRKLDGTLVKMILDFKNEVKIMRLTVLGEEEKHEKLYQRFCFVTHFTKNQFISSDAMSKLRQKNPGTIRNPEEDLGREQLVMDMVVNLEKGSRISRNIHNACMEAQSSTYTREADLRSWSKGYNATYNILLSAVQRLPLVGDAPRCRDTKSSGSPCTCHLDTCVGWYPCGLKYCKGRDSAGNNLNYRCGIKTCKNCRGYDFYVMQKSSCLWDR